MEDAEIMESGGVPERTHVSQTTYIRAVKDSTLKFEKLDRLPEEGYPEEKGQTYLAIVPNNVEAWLNGVCGDGEDALDDQYTLVSRTASSRSVHGDGGKRSRSPNDSGSLLDAGNSFSNPLFDSPRDAQKSSERFSTTLEISELVDEVVKDNVDFGNDPPNITSSPSFKIHEVSSNGDIIKQIK